MPWIDLSPCLFPLVTTSLEEKAMATHSSTLAWKIPWMEEPGRLQSMGLLRVRCDWVTSLSLSCIGEGNGNPLQCSCLENPRDGGAWWAAVYRVSQSQTRLKWLSSSSSSSLVYISVGLFLLYTYICLYYFLVFIYNGYHIVFVFVCLI